MIAKNFVKYPESLRYQREMFSNGYHNSPRIMRLIECVFDWSATIPDWWKEAKGRARDLAHRVKKSINDFFKDMAMKASDQSPLIFEEPKPEYIMKKYSNGLPPNYTETEFQEYAALCKKNMSRTKKENPPNACETPRRSNQGQGGFLHDASCREHVATGQKKL